MFFNVNVIVVYAKMYICCEDWDTVITIYMGVYIVGGKVQVQGPPTPPILCGSACACLIHLQVGVCKSINLQFYFISFN